MHYDFTTDGAPTIAFSLVGGHLEIEGSPTATGVTIDIEGDGVFAEQRRQAIALRAERGRYGEHVTVRMTVPTTATLVGRTATATIVHTGAVRTARLHNAAGSITLGTITDSAVIKTGTGDIAIDEIGGSAVLHTGAGSINVGHVRGTTRLATGIGDIEIGRADAMLDLKSGAGTLTIHHATADVTLKSGTGPVEVHHFEGAHLTARNHSGSITIGLPEGLAVWRDVVTVTGQVRTTLPPTGEPAKGARHAEIRAFTRHGDVTLRPAA